MKQFASFGVVPHFMCVGIGQLPDAPRGRQFAQEGGYRSRARLPSDPAGVVSLTLTNVVPGSRYRVERQSDGSPVTEGVAASSTVVLTLDYYATGNANNDLRIKVRKGTSAPLYKPYETLATIGADDQSVYVAQIPD